MEVITKELEDIQSIVLKGRLDATAVGSVEEKLNTILDSGKFKMIIDLSGVDYISSAGLRVLLATMKKARKEQAGDIRLAGMQPQVQQVFDMAGFPQIFRSFDSMENAIESYK